MGLCEQLSIQTVDVLVLQY